MKAEDVKVKICLNCNNRFDPHNDVYTCKITNQDILPDHSCKHWIKRNKK